MKKFKRYLLLATLTVLCLPLAKAQLSIDAQVRPRTEYSHGQKTLVDPNATAGIITSQRTRFTTSYKSELFNIKVALQDVRTWGNQKQLVGNQSPSVSIHEAWGEARLFEGTYARFGRQELAYDNQRILGSVGWAQQARAHDLALLTYSGVITAHAGLAYHNNTMNSGIYTNPDAYKAMQFIWLNKKSESFSASLLFLNNGVAQTTATDGINILAQKTVYSQTIGTFLTSGMGDLKLSGSFYYQGGKMVTGGNLTVQGTQDLSAYQAMLEASYSIGENYSINAGYELLSGSDFDEAGGSFSPFYGTNHKFNGYMDYFYVGNHMNTVGLQDIYFSGGYKRDKYSLSANVHFFSADGKISTTADQALGTELDIVFKYTASKAFNIMAGYSHMFATESMEIIKGGAADETQNWAFVMIAFTPQLFNSANN